VKWGRIWEWIHLEKNIGIDLSIKSTDTSHEFADLMAIYKVKGNWTTTVSFGDSGTGTILFLTWQWRECSNLEIFISHHVLPMSLQLLVYMVTLVLRWFERSSTSVKLPADTNLGGSFYYSRIPIMQWQNLIYKLIL
jgi:hypothetical protein